MHRIAALLIMFFSTSAIAQSSNGPVEATPWQTYGYIALGAIILIVVVVVLIRKQHRKFNE